MSADTKPEHPVVLLTGATGYIGGRMIEPLQGSAWQLRCMGRSAGRLRTRVDSATEVVVADALDRESLDVALRGVHSAFYLLHSMGEGPGFEERELLAATNFVAAARNAGVQRIIYLGGLGAGGDLSAHLTSRQNVGRILADSGIQTIEFRSSIIIGSGSLSFEIVRALVHRLPVMITPKWVNTPTQPIAVEDVVSYLMAALETSDPRSRIYEIGGPDVTTYGGMLSEYARQLGRRRLMIPVPLLTPWLSSLWLGLVTPVHANVGRELIESIRNETTVRDHSAQEAFGIEPLSLEVALARALEAERTA